jgi:heme oxygenase
VPLLIHQLLRDATGALHAQVERHLPLMSPTLTVDQYRDTLARFYQLYVPLEDAVARAGGEGAAEFVRKAPRLAQDLHALGLPPAAVAPLPPGLLPVLASPAAAVGARYVMEGAALGGQLIARHVSARLGLTPATGLAFFTGDGPQTGARWQAFRDQLLQHPASAADVIVAAAVDTFRTFEAVLAAPPAAPVSPVLSRAGAAA